MRSEWSIKWATKRNRIKLEQSSLRIMMEDKNLSTLQLATTSKFNGVICEFYCKDGEYTDLWLTRKQIGSALEYGNPDDALYRIHERHKDRLDRFSVIDKVSSTDGKSYDVIMYNRRGVMEICRWSRQPKANEFMDWVWNLVEAYQDGKLKSVQTTKSSSIPLDREELAAYMMCNAQMIESYKASTDAVLTRQTECLNTMVGVLSTFTEIESEKTRAQGVMLENNLNALKDANDTIAKVLEKLNYSSSSTSSLVSCNQLSQKTQNIWKTEALEKVAIISKQTGKPKLKVLQDLYALLRTSGIELDAAVTSYAKKNNHGKVKTSTINVIAESPALRTKFDTIINDVLNPYYNKEETRSENRKNGSPLYALLPDKISTLAQKLIPAYGRNISRVMWLVYQNFELTSGVQIKDCVAAYASNTGRNTVNKAYAICQDKRLEKILIDVMKKMAEG